MEDLKKQIEDLAKKAVETRDSTDAQKYSQAALNLAHSYATLDGAAKSK